MKPRFPIFGLTLFAALALLPACADAPQDFPPPREWAMIRQIAANYALTEEQTWLLAAIRCQENGRPGLEFGIGGRRFSEHVAHRYRDGFKSFYVQGSWAAGTIVRHDTGNLSRFARRYCPKDPVTWEIGVRSSLNRLKSRYGNRLPGEAYPKRDVPFLRRGSEGADE